MPNYQNCLRLRYLHWNSLGLSIFALKIFTILVILIKCSFSLFIGKTGEFMKKYLPLLSQISFKKNIVQVPTIPHFKGLSMRNLQYEIRICQKQHTKVAMSTYANVVTVFLKQSLESPRLVVWQRIGIIQIGRKGFKIMQNLVHVVVECPLTGQTSWWTLFVWPLLASKQIIKQGRRKWVGRAGNCPPNFLQIS